MTAYCKIPSPLGTLTVAGDESGVTGLWLEGQKYFASTLAQEAMQRELPVFESVREWLRLYFEGADPGPLPPLNPQGSEFRQAVWKLLLQIPRRQLATYGELAGALEQASGKKSSARAVGGAVGHNPISILIPCHRVVGTGGSLTGYAGGTDKKLFLLRLEQADGFRDSLA